MIIDLSEVNFNNDIAYISCGNGSILVLNKLEEAIAYEDSVSEVRNVNIAILDLNDVYHDCNMAIGLSNDLLRLYSEYVELEGDVLTLDNIDKCKIEVFDE